MTKRQLQSIETKKKILHAVKDLLLEKSFDEIKIRDICSKAGISLGTFYVYFEKKEAALLMVYRELDEVFEGLELDGDPVSNIKTILTAYYNMADMENLNYNIAIYQSHLTYFDAYFFEEERSVFQKLNYEILKLSPHGREITWEILEFCRGQIYNFCIYHRKIPGWQEEKIRKTLQYAQYLINSYE